ncbi:MAG: hypothetical protein ACFFCS_09760 [Candidatus Hodarchaeota archaeon]
MVSYKFYFNGSASNARELIQAFLTDEYIIDNGIKGDAPAGDLENVVFCYPSRKIKKDLFFSKGKIILNENSKEEIAPSTTVLIKIYFFNWFWIVLLNLITALFFLIPTLIKYGERKQFLDELRYKITGEGIKSGKKAEGSEPGLSLTINNDQKVCPFCGNTITLDEKLDEAPVVCSECGIEIN